MTFNSVQEGGGYPTTVSRRPSVMAGQSNGESESSETHVVFHHESAPLSALCSGTNMQVSSSTSQSYASAMGASPRNLTPDLVRSPSPSISALSGDRMSSLDQRYVNIRDLYNEISPEVVPSADIITSLSGLSLSSGTMGDVRKYQKPRMQDRVDVHSQRDNVPFKQYPYSNGTLKETSMPALNRLGSSASHYLNTASPTFSSPNFGLGGYTASPLLMGNQVGDLRALSGGLPFESDLFVTAAEENYAKFGNQSTVDAFPMAHTDPSYLDYLIANGYSSVALDNQRMHVESLANPPVNFLGNRNAYFEASLRRSQYGSGSGKLSTINNGFHGNYAFGLGIPHRGNHIRSTMFPNCSIASGGSDRNVEQIMCFPSTLRNMAHSFGGPWPSGHGCDLDESFAASLLDEFKGNKTRCLELAEIAGHVVEFRYTYISSFKCLLLYQLKLGIYKLITMISCTVRTSLEVVLFNRNLKLPAHKKRT